MPQPTLQRLISCMTLTLALTACNFADPLAIDVEGAPQAGERCSGDGEQREALRCQDGTWQVGGTLDMDAPPDQAQTPDSAHDDDANPTADLSPQADLDSPDMHDASDSAPACEPEERAVLCAQLGVGCGPLMGVLDRCGMVRDIAECGSCGNAEQCEMGECVPDCAGETAQKLCEERGAQCGTLDTLDLCGNAREVRCGSCPEGAACGPDNTCACDPETDEAQCAAAGAECGQLTTTDNCGVPREVACGSCTAREGAYFCDRSNQCACDAETDESFCGRFNAQCGSVQGMDNCGMTRAVNCGGCENNDPCNADKTCPICQPLSEAALCAQQGKTCGAQTLVDNCGTTRTLQCGTCTNDRVCNATGTCECPDASCIGVNCGPVSNACGSAISCPNTCDATSEQCNGNSCECLPESNAQLCSAAAATCGSITRTDRCGTPRTVSCGGCSGSQVCTANACCTPQTNTQLCSAAGATCGSIMVTDNCGTSRTVSCGGCSGSQVCTASNACCTPESDTDLCDDEGAECGQLTTTDNCGTSRTVNSCGSCGANQACTSNQCACSPQTNAQLCSAAGATCGSITTTDRCGVSRTISCGGCSGSQVCTASNACCTPQTNLQLCQSAGYSCGLHNFTDNCGVTRNSVSCGSCPNNTFCNGSSCEFIGCGTPEHPEICP